LFFQYYQGVDAGGPYRECLTEVCTDLFNPEILDLFVRSPNTMDERGQTRDRYVPNPDYTSPNSIKMYEFVGVWMGLSFRTKSNLPFQLPSMVWKTLVGERLTIDDIEEIDDETVERIHSMREKGSSSSSSSSSGVEMKKKKKSMSTKTTNSATTDTNNSDDVTVGETKGQDATSRTAFEERWKNQPFQAKRSGGGSGGSGVSVVDLLPGGADILVTYERRFEYADLLENYRLHEFDQQLAAMRRGFGTIVPLRLMPLFTWQEAEVLVCGSPEIDLDELKRNTAYQGYSGEDDPTIRYFWTVMKEWGHKERSKFIQFAWGRQRLPRPGRWSRRMLLSYRASEGMPVAHTCFFHVELPKYTSLEQARKMLGLTIKYGLGSMLIV